MATDLSPEELAYLQERKAAAQQVAAPVQQAPAQPVAKPIAGNVIPAEQTAPTSQAGVGPVQQPSAAPINYGPMISNVNSAYRDLKQQAPSVLESLDASMPWLKYAAGLVGAGIVGSKLLGQEDTNKPSGIKARSIVKTEPQMDVSVRQPDGRIEPSLDVVEQNIGEKPTIPSSTEAAAQATQEKVKQGKIKTGKAGGSITPQESQILGNIESGKVKGKVSDVVKGAVAPDLTKEQQGMKKYLVSYYGGGPEGEKAYEKVGEILGYRPAFEPGKGGGLKPSENELIKAYRKENIAGPKINLTHDMKKAIKGGSLAALAAIPGFADAAQNKDYGKMADIASDFAVLPFAQSREAGAPTIPDSRFAEAAKLGSPYYNTEWSKKERSKAVPPPSR